ncbi:DNA-binding transcriptional LysR family regulator [Hoeflea marina]|uniref:DNA-binding transcriptional LysR family regulator n=1 Tax=Hoeflea marina TaxID=274592 RepID=A0A317PLC9_9HYPH|nr:LysR family transcriptional regulator [Hoeflea marina]PWV98863.1 DNA-binding transcriptional LysR family regulator [Hoeflea marina]
MDIRFLESLVAVVDAGSIAAAARREGLTAAAVSQRIQALERNLRCTLLARGAHSARPTEACLALLPRARHLIREAAFLQDDVAGGDIAGEIRLGAISTVLTGAVPQLLDETARRAPKLGLQLVPGSSLHLYEQLACGALDAAILVAPPFALPKGLKASLFRREPLMLMTREPLSGEGVGERIARQSFIRYDPSSWGGRLAADYMTRAGLFPEVRFDLDALETIALMVRNGLGNALVPHWQGLVADGFHLVPVPDAADYARDLVFLRHSVSSRPRALDFLLEMVLRA